MLEKITSRGPIRPAIESGVSGAPRVIRKGQTTKGYVSQTSDGNFKDVSVGLEAASQAQTDYEARAASIGDTPDIAMLVRRVRGY